MAQVLVTIAVRSDLDVVIARQRAREVSREIGFGLTDQTRIATAVSEMARRALAKQGYISLAVVSKGHKRGIECTCSGCDFPVRGNSSGKPPDGFGGIEKLMDELVYHNNGEPTVVMRKWLKEVA